MSKKKVKTDIDAMDVEHSITVEVKNIRQFRWRLRFALPFLWLGSRIAGFDFECVDEEDEENEDYEGKCLG